MMKREEPLLDLIFERLAADGIPTKTADVVLAAFSGDDDLAAALAGQPTKLDVECAAATEPRAHIYLSSVTVAGFRGVGPERTLTIRQRPGLTLVVGRNGSGKSSFTEAVELVLTGDSAVGRQEQRVAYRLAEPARPRPLPDLHRTARRRIGDAAARPAVVAGRRAARRHADRGR